MATAATVLDELTAEQILANARAMYERAAECNGGVVAGGRARGGRRHVGLGLCGAWMAV